MKLSEVIIDNQNGWGAVPHNQEVDYFGIRVKMRPSTFIKLASAIETTPSAEIERHIASGGAIGAPYLTINVPDDYDDFATVDGHDGRNRMIAIRKTEGDNPIEVHLFFRGKRKS